jgi:hypothetical protein
MLDITTAEIYNLAEAHKGLFFSCEYSMCH